MRGPVEFLADMWDYHYHHYRYYLHRRLIFSEISSESIKKDLQFNIFKNSDSENVERVVTQTTLIGLSSGVAAGAIKTMAFKDQKLPMRAIAPTLLGMLAVTTGVGFVYGISVKILSEVRGKKNDFLNHYGAAFVAFPALGYFARKEKLKWGFINALLLGGAAALIKSTYTDWPTDLERDTRRLNRVQTYDPAHFRPSAAIAASK